MSAPLVWIVIPMIAGVIFWFYRQKEGIVVLLATILGLLLAAAAFLLPIGQAARIGPWSFEISTTLTFIGRSLVLENNDRVILIYIYLICTFWFAGSHAAGASRLLIPSGYGIVALLVAALAVQPFLYAALLVEVAVLLAVPVLAPPGQPFSQGVLRFLIFQTLAMPFILLAGWALGAFEANPSNPVLSSLAIICLGLGFAFWLAVFPFYTWIPLIAEQASPYAAGFLFLVMSTVDLLLGLSFLDRFGWLREAPALFEAIRMVGVIMVGTAGVWAIFQKNLNRLFGYAVIVETGFSLLAISLGNQVGGELFTSMFLPRMIGMGLWALSLSIITRELTSMSFTHVQGISARYPFAAAGVGVASLALAGLPLLAFFPIRQMLMEELARQSLLTGLVVLAGCVGMLFGSFRALAVLMRGFVIPESIRETRTQSILLATGVIGMLAIGLLPRVFLPLLGALMSAFPQLP
jgi:formate hydrogenlyase subunit 3/multisubunit Na+/H+ antiporter MnhD subunit